MIIMDETLEYGGSAGGGKRAEAIAANAAALSSAMASDYALLQRYIHKRQLMQRQAEALAARKQAPAANDLPPWRPRLSLMAVVVRAALYSPHLRIGRIVRTPSTPSGWAMEVAA